MDRVQPFIEDCLFTKCFDDPSKPIKENRLVSTLFLMPTDGGLAMKLRNGKNHKVFRQSTSVDMCDFKQEGYKTINKNSRVILKEYINKCKKATAMAKSIVKKHCLTERSQFEAMCQEKYPEIWKDLPDYQKFVPMYENIWCSYMAELLGIPEKHKSGSSLSLNGSQALIKLSMADYNGCLIRVSKSKNSCLLGKEGIVMWDAQKSFIIVCKGVMFDELKSIPKKGSTFEFQVPINEEESLAYTIIGDRFKYRSSDRPGRKFKSRRCDDMLYYIES